MSHEPLPALRPLDIIPFADEHGDTHFLLRDPAQLATRGVTVSLAGYVALAHLDGKHSCADICRIYREQFQVAMPAEQIQQLVAALDEALLLQTPRYAAARAAARAAYRAAPVRDNRDRYPPADELRAELGAILQSALPRPAGGEIFGLVAPHLDYARGAPCYAAAYSALAAAPRAERYVILGTNHAGESTAAVATGKDFLTPLGTAPVDHAFLEALEQRLGASLREHEFDHANEHSVELQVHVLQYLHEGQPFSIVPILCPSPCGPTGTRPVDGKGPDLGSVADAIAAVVNEIPGRSILIAAADLSHVGQRFGDPEPTSDEFLARVARSDRALLHLLETRAEEEFLEQLRKTDNRTRVCSAGCLYALLRALPGRSCRVLHYHQAVDRRAETHVTCAACIIS